MPHVDDYAKSQDDLQVFGLIFGVQALGRIYVSPPGLPPERRDALRTAFIATMADPQFLADAAKTQIDVNPVDGRGGRSIHRSRVGVVAGRRRAGERALRAD